MNFRYKQQGDENVRGRSIVLNGSRSNVHILFGANNNTIYWVEFNDDDGQSDIKFQKVVRKGIFLLNKLNTINTIDQSN